MTKGAGSPAKALNFFMMMPEMTTAAMPMKKADTATRAEPPNIAPAKRPIMGILAPQGINPGGHDGHLFCPGPAQWSGRP